MQAEPSNNGSVFAVERMMQDVNEDCRRDAEERRNREMQAFMKSQKKTTEDMMRLHQRYLRKKEDDKCKNGKPQNVHHMFPAIITQSSPPERIQIKEELPYIPQKKIPQKRSNDTSPDLLKGMCLPNANEPTVNLQSRLQTPMTSLRMPISSCALLPSSLSQVTTPCAQFPTISHNQLQTSSVGGGFVNYQGLPHPNHQQYQRIPYQNHAGIQQQNKGNLGGVLNSRVPDLYGLNQKSSMNPSQANYLQNGIGMTGSYNYLHNYHWMNQNAHSSLHPGSTIGNMGYSQFPNAQNSTKQNLPTPHAQSHNLNGNVDQLNYANNGYNGMTMGHHWNPAMSAMQNYYMNASSSAQVPQQSQIQEQKPQLYNGHPNLPQNFVTNPVAGSSPANSSTSHGGPPSATQSIHADYSPTSSSGHTPGNPSSASQVPFNQTKVDGSQKRQSEQGTLPQSSNHCSGSNWANNYGTLDSCYMMNMGMNNVNNFASEEIRNELNVYLGPGHCDFQTQTPMPSNTFAGHHSNYYGYSGNPVYDQLK
ncbi:hypothetical protein Ddc_07534 [Ditylenchus destructor]|nr:hypothetical protein Ddc_07534 [Ditylenchus destructor]